jgi:hypothetical protein
MTMRVPDAFDYDDAEERPEDDHLVCRRCGKDGLYWMTVTTFDGKSDKPMLFDSANKRRHVCAPLDDGAFEVVSE